MLNHITIMGRLTRDPELRWTQSQTPVASFTLAVDRDFSDKQSGEKQTDFIDCVAWRQTAQFVDKYFQKGSMAVVAGRLQIRDWTDRDGNKRRSAEVVAENVYFGESKRQDDDRRGSYGGNNYNNDRGGYNGNNSYNNDRGYRSNNSYNNSRPAFAELEEDDGDLPF